MLLKVKLTKISLLFKLKINLSKLKTLISNVENFTSFNNEAFKLLKILCFKISDKPKPFVSKLNSLFEDTLK